MCIRWCATVIQALNNIRVTILVMRDKCKIINVQQNAKHLQYTYHRLFVNFLVVTSEKLLNISFDKFNYYVFYISVTDYGAPKSRDLRLLSKHASKSYLRGVH